MKVVTETVKNETKERKGGFLSILLGMLGASLLCNLLTGKGVVRAGYGNNKGKGVVRAGCGNNNKGKGVVRAGYGNQSRNSGFLIPPHPLTNFEIQKYDQNEPRFNGVQSRNNLPKQIKDGAYVINLDEYKDTATHWIALFCKKMKLFTLIALVLNIYLKKFKNLLVIET